MKNLSVKFKISLILVIGMIMSIFTAVTLSVFVNRVFSQSERIFYDQLYTVSADVLKADRDLYQASVAELSFVSGRQYSSKHLLEEYAYSFEENATQAYEGVKAIEELAAEYPEVGEASTNGKTINDCISDFYTFYDIWKNAYDPATDTGEYANAKASFESVRSPLNTMGEIMEAYATENHATLEKSISKTLSLIITIVVIIMIVAVIISYLIIRVIVKNLKSVTDGLNTLANNDLTQEIKAYKGKDEIGQLNQATISLQQNLRSIMSRLHVSSLDLAEASSNMSRATRNSADGVENINHAAGELANTATSQATDISDIVNQMSGIDELMQNNNENAEKLADTSDEIRDTVDAGVQTVDNLKAVSLQSLEAFENIFAVIDDISSSANRISEASDMIKSIAQQTNLLSLNASIEAARAGEAGKGFAVVADEIRNLSDQSSSSVETINEMLEALQRNTTEAAHQSELVRDYVNKQQAAVVETAGSFEAIADRMNTVNGAVDALKDTNDALSQGVEGVSGLISSLSAISEENAATAQELNATTETVNMNVENLSAMGTGVDDSAKGLEEIIAVFKMNAEIENN
ncbi:MAG: HAMP domain-containing protein [Lachnospiraceae bacterium]|nr:HAMP domain-containing protein [Lachnospiraceae bacterium]